MQFAEENVAIDMVQCHRHEYEVTSHNAKRQWVKVRFVRLSRYHTLACITVLQ